MYSSFVTTIHYLHSPTPFMLSTIALRWLWSRTRHKIDQTERIESENIAPHSSEKASNAQARNFKNSKITASLEYISSMLVFPSNHCAASLHQAGKNCSRIHIASSWSTQAIRATLNFCTHSLISLDAYRISWIFDGLAAWTMSCTIWELNSKRTVSV